VVVAAAQVALGGVCLAKAALWLAERLQPATAHLLASPR
jgi:HAMP domain-containing protein